MKVGDYVRTEISGLNIQRIGKIKKIISDNFIHTDIGTYDKEYIIKSSPNIIDLIEVGDYVNGKNIDEIDIHRKKLYSYERDDYYIYDERDIKSIVTKEQFESEKYEV